MKERHSLTWQLIAERFVILLLCHLLDDLFFVRRLVAGSLFFCAQNLPGAFGDSHSLAQLTHTGGVTFKRVASPLPFCGGE